MADINESILEDLVDVMRGSIGRSAIATIGIAEENNARDKLNKLLVKSTTDYKKQQEIARKNIKEFGDAVAGVTKNYLSYDASKLTDFTKQMGGFTTEIGHGISDFGVKISELTQTVPILGGVLGSLISTIGNTIPLIGQSIETFGEAIQNDLDTFRKFSEVGLDFGNSISDFRYKVSDTNLSIDAFNRVLSSNSQMFAQYGGSVNAGSKRFIEVSKILQNDFEPMFSKLGYTAESMNEGIASYMTIQTRLGNSQKMDQNALSTGSRAYLLQLDELTRLTGMSRKEAAKSMEQLALEQQVKAVTLGMTKEQKTDYELMISTLRQKIPEAAKGFEVLMARWGAAASESQESIALAATVPEAAEMAIKYRQGSATMNDVLHMFANAAVAQSKLSQGFKEFASTNPFTQLAFTMLLGAENLGSGIDAVSKEQQDAIKANEKSIAGIENTFQRFKNAFAGVLTPILQAFETNFGKMVGGKPMGTFIDKMTEYSNTLAKFIEEHPIGDMLGLIADKISSAFDYISSIFNIFNREGASVAGKKMYEDLSNNLKDHVWPYVKDAFTDAFHFLAPYLVEGFKAFIKYMEPMFNALSGIIGDIISEIGLQIKASITDLLDQYLPDWMKTKRRYVPMEEGMAKHHSFSEWLGDKSGEFGTRFNKALEQMVPAAQAGELTEEQKKELEEKKSQLEDSKKSGDKKVELDRKQHEQQTKFTTEFTNFQTNFKTSADIINNAFGTMAEFMQPRENTAMSSAMGIVPAGGDNVAKAMSYFMSVGHSKEEAAAIVANLQAESGADLNPRAINPDSGAYGIGQWLGSRVEDFYKTFGHSLINSPIEEQLQFVEHELRTTEKKAGDLLKAVPGLQNKTFVGMAKFERPSAKEQRESFPRRMAYAQALMGSEYPVSGVNPMSAMATPADTATTAYAAASAIPPMAATMMSANSMAVNLQDLNTLTRQVVQLLKEIKDTNKKTADNTKDNNK